MDPINVRVGQDIQVWWSNGAGYSIYTVVDDPGAGPHKLALVGNWEVQSGGGYAPVEL